MKKWIPLVVLLVLPTAAHAGFIGRCWVEAGRATTRFTALCDSINTLNPDRCCTEFMRRGMVVTHLMIQSRLARETKRTDDQAFERDFPVPTPTPTATPIPTPTPTATPTSTPTATPGP